MEVTLRTCQSVPFYACGGFDPSVCAHGFSTRLGGVSVRGVRKNPSTRKQSPRGMRRGSRSTSAFFIDQTFFRSGRTKMNTRELTSRR